MATARFWRENAARYNMIGTQCTVCGKVHFPPRSVCPTCHRKSLGKMQPIRLKGEGEIFSYTVVHEAPSQFEMLKPYVMAIIRMREGVMVTGQIIDVDPHELAIGMKVKATMRKLGTDGPGGIIHYGYKFAPVRQ
jgi:uncharacterized protein